jgi:hypothetical protein
MSKDMKELMQQAMNDPELNIPANPDAYLLRPEANTLASHFYRQLAHYIIAFEKHLNPDQEVGVKMVAFGEAITMHVEAIEYSDPSLITFYGFGANRKPMQLIQHLTQLNFLLTAVDKIPNQPSRTTIGFQLQQQLDNYLQKTLSTSTQPPAGPQA